MKPLPYGRGSEPEFVIGKEFGVLLALWDGAERRSLRAVIVEIRGT